MDFSLVSVVRLIHVIALVLGVGAATAKNLLLYRCKRDHAFASTFLEIEVTLTRQIIVGQALLTLSGIAYALLLGYGFTLRLTVKVVLLAILWVLGPSIDNAISPKFKKAVPAPGGPITPEYERALSQYLFWDITATGIFYAIIILWMAMV